MSGNVVPYADVFTFQGIRFHQDLNFLISFRYGDASSRALLFLEIVLILYFILEFVVQESMEVFSYENSLKTY